LAVYKDKKSGKWYFRVYVDDPITGMRIQKTKKGFDLRRDAIDAESILVAQYQNQDVIVDSIRFDDLIDEFLVYQKKKLKITTLVGYEYQINAHIRPFFNNVRLRDITKASLDKWYNNVSEQEYTYNYKNKLLLRLKSIFDYADQQYGYRNRYLYTLTNFKKQPGEFESSVTIYNEEMFNKFIEAANNDLEKTIFMTFYYSGIRISELRALKWIDIDFKNMTIKIQRQVTSKLPGQGDTIITPKSESSIRTIYIPKLLNEQLKKWKQNRMQYKSFEVDWNVFGDYTFISENRIRRACNRMSKDAALPHIKIHDFRHSYSTLLHNKGVDPKIIQAQAGHSTVQITLDTYTHITTKQKQQAIADVFDDDKESS